MKTIKNTTKLKKKKVSLFTRVKENIVFGNVRCVHFKFEDNSRKIVNLNEEFVNDNPTTVYKNLQAMKNDFGAVGIYV